MLFASMCLLVVAAFGFVGSLAFTAYHLENRNWIRTFIGIIGIMFFLFWGFVDAAAVMIFW
ncbi:TPA: hypothetical protein QCR36_004004 [Bacillus cereus]|nr:hypothetical protein [Bacillus cereus]HDR4742472.1 hypothetical protein [Bacillus cereus]HDR4748059.1 hypothetical protein [Bacillus cereus]HDR4753533.1 hypothetical protein [Bacillus cereus]HDR4770742.1 hypothetical protein [Bacillus cereus]